MKTKINKCHPAIESIQLYSYREVKTDHSTEYIIEYIDGGHSCYESCSSSRAHISVFDWVTVFFSARRTRWC